MLAAFFGTGLAGVYAYSMGAMIAPLEAEFGWERARITSGFFIVSVFSVLFSMVMGMIIDRVGPRRLAIAGVVIYCTALALLSQASDSIPLWLGLWSLIALGIMFIKPTVWVAAISSLFTASRGLALAVVLSSTGFVSFLLPMVTVLLVDVLGWRMTFVALGAGSFVIVMPLVLLFFTSAKDRTRSAPPAEAGPAGAILTGLTLKEGLTSRSFIFMGIGGFLFTLASVGLTLNIIPILTAEGLSRELAAATAGAVGLSQIVGRLAGGYLLDRFNARMVAGVSVALPIATCLLLLFGGGWGSALVAVIFLGLATGAEMDAIAYLSARCFGLRNFAALFGAFMGVITLGFGTGPIIANAVYDQTGSYDMVLWSIMPIVAIASLLFLTIGPYPVFADRSAD